MITRPLALLVAAGVVVALPAVSSAAPKPRDAARPLGACSVDGSTVTASGLPTDELVNFFVLSDAGSTGWVLGTTDDGTWAVSVPERSGPTTYEFGSRTWGKDGRQYTVFASCSA